MNNKKAYVYDHVRVALYLTLALSDLIIDAEIIIIIIVQKLKIYLNITSMGIKSWYNPEILYNQVF